MSRQKPSSCIGCSLYGHGSDFSQPEGTGRNGILVIAEASGESEARDLLPLRPWAPAGGVFERTLRRLGLAREDFVISNLLRCRPRSNLLSGMSYESSAVQHCTPNLEALYFKAKPRVILALGNLPFSYLTGEGGPGRTVTHCRGYLFPVAASYSARMAEDAERRGVVVMPTYHPSHIRRGATELSGVLARDIARAVNIAAGKDAQYVLGHPLWAMYREELGYQVKPSLEDAYQFLVDVKRNPELLLAYDIETYETESLDEDMRDEFRDTRIRQIQFTLRPGSGIAMPWNKEFREVVRRLMASDNPKVGWNSSGFDDRVLSIVSEQLDEPGAFVPKGQVHDAMQMWKRWQPELPANLQYAASFVRFPFTWKHMSHEHLGFYGVCDTDATHRLATMLMGALQSRGLYDQYVLQVANLHDLPAQVAHHGLTVSQPAAKQVETELIESQARVQARLEALYPESERTYTPSEGYKLLPKQVKERKALWASEQRGILIGERTVLDFESEQAYVERTTGLVERSFVVPVKDPQTTMTEKKPQVRWCRRDTVSPRSRPQIIRYAKLKKHEVPQTKQPDGTTKDSLTLADIDLMYGCTKDEFYLLVGRWRRMEEEKEVVRGLALLSRDYDQQESTSVIHPVFRIEQDGKLGARNPTLPQPDSEAMKVIVARSGKVFVQWRWPSQRDLILANLCGSKGLAEAIVTGTLYRLEGVATEALEGFLLGDSDRAILNANRLVFGTAQKSIMAMRMKFNHLFPEVAKWQEEQLQRAHLHGASTGIVNRFGEIRWFYEAKRPDGRGGWSAGDQASAAIRFLPESEAVGAVKARLGQLRAKGLDAKWGLCMMTRDWITFEVGRERIGEHIRELWGILAGKVVELSGVQMCVEIRAGESMGTLVKLDVRK